MSRQNRPVVLIIGGIAVLAAVLLLWLIMESGDDDAPAAPDQVASGSSFAVDRTPPARASGDRPGAPRISSSTRPAGSADNTGYTETIVNGVRVRDHRKDRSQPVELPSSVRAPGSRTIDAKITRSINDRLLPLVRECAAGVPAEARGEKPRVEGRVVIAIKDGQAQVTQANVDLSDVVGASIEPTKQCLTQKAMGISVPAPDEPDLESYPITIRYAVP